MKRLICTSCEIRLPMRVDQVHWRLRLWQNAAAILRSPNLGAVVIGLVVGVARFVNSSPEDAGTIPPRPPAFQSFLDKRIHARVIDTVAVDFSGKPANGSPTPRGASTTGWSSSELEDATTLLCPM